MDAQKPNQLPRTFIINDASSLPFRSSVFEKVALSHVLKHLKNRGITLIEIGRVLRSGGQVEIYTPDFTPRNATSDPDHKHVFNCLSLKQSLSQSGFRTSTHFPTPSSIFPGILGKISLIGLYGEPHAVGIKES